MKVKLLIYRVPPEDGGGFWAEVPALPGCVTHAATLDELRANVRDAVEGVLLTPRGDFEPGEPGGMEEEVEV
jgi:predicted RNase H-like HicB family nuclease